MHMCAQRKTNFYCVFTTRHCGLIARPDAHWHCGTAFTRPAHRQRKSGICQAEPKLGLADASVGERRPGTHQSRAQDLAPTDVSHLPGRATSSTWQIVLVGEGDHLRAFAQWRLGPASGLTLGEANCDPHGAVLPPPARPVLGEHPL